MKDFVKSNNIDLDNITDAQIIHYINNGYAGFGLLFQKQSVAVQLATFNVDPETAKLFEYHCEELKTLILLS